MQEQQQQRHRPPAPTPHGEDDWSSPVVQPPLPEQETQEGVVGSSLPLYTETEQRERIHRQEVQIHYLRHKLEQYANVCNQHNIGQDLLSRASRDYNNDDDDDDGDGDLESSYRERTYAQHMGPWDIPFHVAIEGGYGKQDNADPRATKMGDQNDDECSGVTMAQHPCRWNQAAVQLVDEIAYCPTDEQLPSSVDGAEEDQLPIKQAHYHYTSYPLSPCRRPPTLKTVNGQNSGPAPESPPCPVSPVVSKSVSWSEPLTPSSRGDFSALTDDSYRDMEVTMTRGESDHVRFRTDLLKHPIVAKNWHENGLGSDDDNYKYPRNARVDPGDDRPNRVRRMKVTVRRKYCQQKAMYSGALDPRTGNPHGLGTLHFLTSGDLYMGDIVQGQMHGRGTYCYRKQRKIFRGDFVNNSFVGDMHASRVKCWKGRTTPTTETLQQD